jgi:hypothetical protein
LEYSGRLVGDPEGDTSHLGEFLEELTRGICLSFYPGAIMQQSEKTVYVPPTLEKREQLVEITEGDFVAGAVTP